MPTPAADRNLLFGIHALQAGLIDRDQLVAAMNAWVLEKETPLGDILVRQAALDADAHALLAALVEKALARHGNDPHKSLAAASSLGSVREALDRLGDPQLSMAVAAVATDPLFTQPAPPPPPDGSRFRVLRPHAKGGLGEVSVALDAELSREVALKEIQPRYAHDADSRARFLREAEITGKLEHPGIVPVYGLGAHPDGRPYYAMRFVEGDSLEEAIRSYHDRKGELSATDRALELRGLLKRFVDVCEAVAYAHSRGVLHRDLKPGNVMLGKFGETLLVDWGLAKAAGAAEPVSASDSAAEPPVAASGSEAGSAPTQAGQTLGTPAYMSPEQATGRLDLLGPASDVYGLGAILFELLTGRPPVEGDSIQDVLRKVTKGEIASPRQVDPSVPKPLDAVCKKALSLRPQDRYASAKDVAAEVERYLADEPVSALPETRLEKAGRWSRRNRQAVRTAAIAGLILLAAAGASGEWYRRDREARRIADAERATKEAAAKAARETETRLRAEQARKDIDEATARAAELRGDGRWDAATTFLAAAERRLPEAADPVSVDRLRLAKLDLSIVRDLDEVRWKKAAEMGKLDYSPDPFNGRNGAYAQAFGRYLAGIGQDHSGLFDDPIEVSRTFASSAIAPYLSAGLDDWTNDETDSVIVAVLLDVARDIDPDPLRNRLRDPALRTDGVALRALAGNTDAAALPTATVRLLAGRLVHKGLYDEAIELLRTASARRPDDFGLHFQLAVTCSHVIPHFQEAIEHYHAALAIRPVTAALMHNCAGVLLESRHRETEAEAAFRRAIESDPGYADAYDSLGHLLKRTGRADEAEAFFRTIEADPREIDQGSSSLEVDAAIREAVSPVEASRP